MGTLETFEYRYRSDIITLSQKCFLFLEAIKNKVIQPCSKIILHITDTNYRDKLLIVRLYFKREEIYSHSKL